MPYKLRGNCVIKKSGTVVKCHSSRRKALAHLAALKINVKESRLYEAIDLTPPEDVRRAALRGLALRRKHGRGGLDTQQAGKQGIGSGVARARDLAGGKAVSPATIRRMVAFFARHEANKDTPLEKGNGKIAWLLWGGDAGQRWASSKARQMEAVRDMAGRLSEHLAGQHNQKSHANRFGSADAIRANVKRLGKDKEALKKMAGRARQSGLQGEAKRERKKALQKSIENMDRDELLELRSRIDRMLGESGAANQQLANEQPQLDGKKGNVVTAVGTDPTKKYEMRYELRELDDLVTSNTDDGRINPDYPKELQPRDRTRASSRAQVAGIAADLEPDALLDEYKAIDRGTPIIGSDNAVESGNGRSMALQKAAKDHPEQYDKYKKRLAETAAEKGIDPDEVGKMRNPVLVRVRTDDTDRVQFAKDANTSGALGMSDSERARNDASRIKSESLQNIQAQGDLDTTLRSPRNRDFVRSFVANTPETERAEMMDKTGNLTQRGEKRIKAAMFNRVYDSPELTDRIFESTDNDVKNITNGMMNSLGNVSKAEELVRTGQRAGDISISDDITKAVNVYTTLKQRGMSVDDYLSQGQMFGRELTPTQEKIMVELHSRRRSGKQVKEFLDGWNELVEAEPHPQQTSMFGPGGRSKDELVDTWIERARTGGQMGMF
jgi:hypothetical protein